MDSAATPETAKCKKYYTAKEDGLKQDWNVTTFCNLPYGRNIIEKWVRKAYEESQKHNITTVLLIPARTDTKYWHEYVMKAHEIRLIKGRVKFGNATNSTPFPSCVVIFKGGVPRRILRVVGMEL